MCAAGRWQDRALINDVMLPSLTAFLANNFYVSSVGDPTCSGAPPAAPCVCPPNTYTSCTVCDGSKNFLEPSQCLFSVSPSPVTVASLSSAIAALKASAGALLSQLAELVSTDDATDHSAVVAAAAAWESLVAAVTSSLTHSSGSFTVASRGGVCNPDCHSAGPLRIPCAGYSMSEQQCGSVSYPSAITQYVV
jgi:hypothetical protein